MTLPAMLDDLPTDCDVGMKKDSKGYKSTWVGYKAAPRRGRRPDSDQLPPDVRFPARQPGRHSAGDLVGRADDQSQRMTLVMDARLRRVTREPIHRSTAATRCQLTLGRSTRPVAAG